MEVMKNRLGEIKRLQNLVLPGGNNFNPIILPS